MPYLTIADLPKAQTDQYTPHQKRAFSRRSTMPITSTSGMKDEHLPLRTLLRNGLASVRP